MLDFFRDLFLTKIISAIVKWFKQLFSFIRKNKIKKFYKVINSKEFKEFELAVLKQYYGEEFFTLVNNSMYPAFSVKYEDVDMIATKNIRDFDHLTSNTSELRVAFKEEEHQGYKKNLYYKKYVFNENELINLNFEEQNKKI